MLAIRRFGSGTPVVALHGFSLTGAQFSRLSLDGVEIVAPDLPGHGQSPGADPDPETNLSTVAASIASTATGAPLLGYSQGARLALTLAARHMITAPILVVVSGTAGVAAAADRQARARQDADLALAIRQKGVEAFVDDWTGKGPMSTAHLDAEARNRDRRIRLENTADGLVSAVVGYGQGVLPPVWQELHHIGCPVLIITGRDDAKYTTLGVRIAAAIGSNAELVTINRSGHNPFNDQPQATAAIIGGFLRQFSSIGSGDPLDQS